MSIRRTLAFFLLAGAVTASPARADGFLVPFFGVNFGDNSRSAISDAVDADRFNWGASLGYMGGGVLGLEMDIGYSPDFHGRTDLGGSSVFTAMGNVLIGIPIGGQSGVGIRPYVLGGLGMIRSEFNALGDLLSFDNSKPGWNFGGGAMFFFGTHVGLRADVRYFRTFSAIDLVDTVERQGRLDFSRASTGLILRF